MTNDTYGLGAETRDRGDRQPDARLLAANCART